MCIYTDWFMHGINAHFSLMKGFSILKVDLMKKPGSMMYTWYMTQEGDYSVRFRPR